MEHITATQGHWLTEKAPQNERGFYKEMFLAASVPSSDYEEWTDEQKEAWEKARMSLDVETEIESLEEIGNELSKVINNE